MGLMDWFKGKRGDDPERLLDRAVTLYDNGKYGESAELLLKASELGYAAAQNNLGYLYETGKGVEEDQAKAIEWYGKAADQDYTAAVFNLGLCYFRDGELQDHGKAFGLLSRAYGRSVKECAYYLAECYLYGLGTGKDVEKGLKLLREASDWSRTAAEGEERFRAPLLLGRIYDAGEMVDADPELAARWYGIAAIRGSECAKERLAELE